MEKDIIAIKQAVEDYEYYVNTNNPERRLGIIKDRIMPFCDHFYYGKKFRNRSFQIFISCFINVFVIIFLLLILF